jgi:hypothetical protein
LYSVAIAFHTPSTNSFIVALPLFTYIVADRLAFPLRFQTRFPDPDILAIKGTLIESEPESEPEPLILANRARERPSHPESHPTPDIFADRLVRSHRSPDIPPTPDILAVQDFPIIIEPATIPLPLSVVVADNSPHFGAST